MGQPEAFIHFTKDLIAADGKVTNSGTEKFLQDFVNHYVTWVKRFQSGE
jgi:chromate reductase